MLFGRDAECSALEALVTGARHGVSGVLVVRGEPGMGKTTLLQHAATVARPMTVVSASGVESESELSYATLHQLLHPLLGHLPALPEVQRTALSAALGLAPSARADRLLIGAAVLTLLGEAGAAGGLCCIVDDLQWCDQASVHALLFAFRRLTNEGVAAVLGTRPVGGAARQDLPTLDLGGLDEEATALLLRARSGVAPSPRVVTKLTELTAGHPLSLAELVRLLSPDQLQGRSAFPDPLPLSRDLQRSFLQQVRQLSPPAQLALVVCALDGTGRMGVLLAAAEELGLDESAMVEAQDSGLVAAPRQHVTFLHPLVRSAVVAGASLAERRRAHRALAAALDPRTEGDRRVWHVAAAVLGSDDAVAADLEESAARSMARGAPASAAVALQRAAELTSDVLTSARRHLASARAAWLAGHAELAYSALDLATSQSSDRLLLAEVADLRGLLQWRQGDAAQAHAIFLNAATTVAHDQPAMALRMLVHAVEAASWFGDAAGLLAAGRLAAGITPVAGSDADLYQDYALGLSALLTGDSAAGGCRLGRVIAAAAQRQDADWLVRAAKAAMYIGAVTEAAAFAQQATESARLHGLTASLVQALEMVALLEHAQGHDDAAQAAATEGLQLAQETGQTSSAALFWAGLASVAAQRGEERACLEAAEQAWQLARPRRLGLAAAVATHAVAQLEMTHGNHHAAYQRLVELAAAGPGEGSPSVSVLTLGDTVELAIKLGRPAEAAEVLRRLEQWAQGSGRARGQSLLLRCQALLADGEAGTLFEAAIATHPEGEAPLELARTRLAYGQWLRRNRRNTEARTHLRSALQLFTRLSCRPLADVAGEELRAAGAAVPQAAAPVEERLTGQERTIARLVSQGSSTKDVAARLYLSPRTVEYHLHKIYPKLGVRSRAELASVLAHAH
ncbi:MAG TPA: AAA family ATPase [Propionibacteriaceae bacterium]|nr:AAA family ATPase [Propionibacteriaceae bacterium]